LKNIKRKTEIKYTEGLASSFELTQAQNNYLSAQGGFTQATLNLLQAKINLKKVLNNL
jgi:outer membrane protein